jgi:outer membrane protein, heavy metal efflux system
MHTSTRRLACGLATLSALWAPPVAATPCSVLSRENVVRCTREASLERRAGEAAVRAADGRLRANDPWLPANPELALAGSRRRAPGESALNWSASLGLEVEVAGQRGARRAAALAERDVQRQGVEANARLTFSDAFRLYFEVLAAREERTVLDKLSAATTRVFEAARAAAERGAAAGIDADVADSARIAVLRRAVDAARAERVATVSLASLVGLTPSQPLQVTGLLEPFASAARVQPDHLAPDSPEVRAFTAEKRAFSARASSLRRSRVPNPRLSVFVQRDGFNENVVGVGLALPLPLPEPIGRTFAGQIAESEALSQRASLLAENSRRTRRAELLRAIAEYQLTDQLVRAFDAERLAHAQQALDNLASELQAGRVSIRDAIVLQGPLIELLLGAIEAKRALCLASVEVLRTAGLPFEGTER